MYCNSKIVNLKYLNLKMNIAIKETIWHQYGNSSAEMLAYWEGVFSRALHEGLTMDEMENYNADQITLLAYLILRQEMLEGGLVQLIYNGYGPFIFHNPFAKALRLWGLKDFSKFIYGMRELYDEQGADLEGKDLSDDDFMALYEMHPELEEADDDFIEMEPSISKEIFNFVFQNPSKFGICLET